MITESARHLTVHDQISLLDSCDFHLLKSEKPAAHAMRQIPKTELSPDNGCIIDTKWKLGPLSYHASAAGRTQVPLVAEVITAAGAGAL